MHRYQPKAKPSKFVASKPKHTRAPSRKVEKPESNRGMAMDSPRRKFEKLESRNAMENTPARKSNFKAKPMSKLQKRGDKPEAKPSLSRWQT